MITFSIISAIRGRRVALVLGSCACLFPFALAQEAAEREPYFCEAGCSCRLPFMASEGETDTSGNPSGSKRPDAEADSAVEASGPSGHDRMLELLADIAARTPDEHPYLGTQFQRQHRQELARLGDRAPARLHLSAGMAELYLGNEREAIALLEAAERGIEAGSIQGDPATLSEIRFSLGVAYMRLGETENCCEAHTAESCILPIRGGGLHGRPEGSSNAAEYFIAFLKNPPNDYWHLAAMWLLNIAHMTLDTYPDEVPARYRLPPDRFQPERDFPKFRNIAPDLGLDTFSLAGGAIADDFTGDGYLDIVVSTWDTREELGQIRFFVNNGDGTFTERTDEAGLTGILGGLNLMHADYNNSGHLDVLVLRGAWLGEAGRHPNSLLRNDGDGTFTDVTIEAGLAEVHYPTQTAAWADFNNNGWLDLYIGNETTPGVDAPGQLFRNNGDGTFTDIASEAGVENNRMAKSVASGDFNGNGLPDLYVSNLGSENRLYRNQGDGTFVDVAPELEVTGPIGSFPAWFWDFNNNGILDLYVSSYSLGIGHLAAYYLGLPHQHDMDSLYLGDGEGGFTDVAMEVGLDYPTMPMGSNFGDLDNDGYLDFYLGTGDTQFYSLMPNVMFLNSGGRKFRNVTMAGGFGHLQKGHGVAFADFNNNGNSDVFIQMGGAFAGDRFQDAFFENPGFGNHWITIQLVGTESNRSAIGARIRLEIEESGSVRPVYRHVNSGGSFGGNPLRQTIGLGKADRIRAIEIDWPTTGKTQRFEDVERNQMIRIVEDEEGFSEIAVETFEYRR